MSEKIELENAILYHGDCLEKMKLIEDKSVDMILCDLPYGVLNKSNKHAQWDNIIPFEPLWNEYKRIIKDKGAIVLFAQGMFTAQLMMSNSNVRCVWSFGNKGATYIYGKDREMIKHAFHLAIYENNGQELETFGIEIPRELLLMKADRKKYLTMKSFINTKMGRLQLQSLETFVRLNRLQSLKSLNRLPILYKGSYNEVPIRENSILYCDIPYNNTGDKRDYKYCVFDYNMYWCAKQKNLVIVSEYNMPQDKFHCIAEKEIKSKFSSTSNTTKATERLFIPIHQKDMYYSRINSNKIQLSLF